jgi:hypothetical protein
MSLDFSCRPSVTPKQSRRRGTGIAEWIIPSAALILMPKCPMCVAMYVALFTSASISVASASHIRTAIGVLCGAVLFGLTVKGLRRAGRESLAPSCRHPAHRTRGPAGP